MGDRGPWLRAVLCSVAASLSLAACSAGSTSSSPGGTTATSSSTATSSTGSSTTGSGLSPSLTLSSLGEKLQCQGSAPDPTQGVTSTTIKVGGLATITGPTTAVWGDAIKAAEARFDAANASGGVNGRTIDFVGAQDDQLSDTQDVDAARTLVEQQKVFAVAPVATELDGWAGPLCSSEVPAVGWAFNSGLCGRYNTFGINGCVVGYDSVSDKVSGSTGPVFEQLLSQNGNPPKTVGLIGNDDASARTGLQTLATGFSQAGFKVTYDQAVLPDNGSLGDPSPIVNAITTSASGKPPSIVYEVSDFNNSSTITQALRAGGYTGILVNAVGYDPRLKTFSTFQGSYTSLQWLPFEETSNPVVAQMISDIDRYEPGTTFDLQAAEGWLSADFLVAALQGAGRDLTIDSFLKYLNSGDFHYGGNGMLPAVDYPVEHVIGAPCVDMVQLKNDQYSLAIPLTCGTVTPKS